MNFNKTVLGIRGDEKTITSSVTKNKYHINSNIKCYNSGIYGVTCKCVGQYSGKTTLDLSWFSSA